MRRGTPCSRTIAESEWDEKPMKLWILPPTVQASAGSVMKWEFSAWSRLGSVTLTSWVTMYTLLWIFFFLIVLVFFKTTMLASTGLMYSECKAGSGTMRDNFLYGMVSTVSRFKPYRKFAGPTWEGLASLTPLPSSLWDKRNYIQDKTLGSIVRLARGWSIKLYL